MSKKRIIIPGWSLGDSSFGVTKTYLEYFSQFGQVEILTPRKDIVDCDLVVMPGGKDADPFLYNDVPGFYTSDIDVYKNYFVKQNLQQYIDKGTPIVGICLGFQSLAIHFGSKLTQNMYHPYSSPRTELVHEVHKVIDNERGNDGIYRYIKEKKTSFKVNSLHHQAVSQFDLAECLKPLYVDEQGYFVEIFEHRTLPIFAVQFHPEETYCKYTTNKIKKLLDGN